MRNIKRLVFLGVILFAIGIVGMLFTFPSAGESAVQEEETIDTTFNAIDVQADNATVEIIPTNDNTSKVTLEGKQYNSKERLSVHVENEELSVQANDHRHQLFHFDFFDPKLTLQVYVPQKQYAKLNVYSDNGKIDVQHLQVESAHVESGNGKLDMHDLAGSELIAETDNGKMNGTKLQVDQIDMQSHNGKVELQQVNGEVVKAKTDNGKLILDEVDGDINGQTNNGAISLTTDHLNKDIDLKTDNGKINVQTETEPTNTTIITNTDNGSVNVLGQYNGGTVIGDGDYVVELTTNNGGITVTKEE